MPEFTSSAWLVVPVVGPLILGLMAFVLGPRWHSALGMVAAILVGVAASVITTGVGQMGPLTHALGGWPEPLGIALYADGLTCVMLGLSAVIGLFASLYARDYFGHGSPHAGHGPSDLFWPLWLLLWSALHGLFLSRDVFNLYVTLELLTLAAVGLVALGGSRQAIEAALRYLIAALAGSLLYLAAVALLYGLAGGLDFATLRAAKLDTPTLQAALLLAMLGLMVKTALFPFHFWLPPAHARAPAPASALLSALVVKGSFYILLRLWFEVFPADVVQPLALVPTTLGVAAIVWGSFQAILAERVKTLVAYSTVAQLGYLFLVFGLATPTSPWGPAAWVAGVLMVLAHGLAKAALFLAAGTIQQATGDDRIEHLAGAGQRLPLTFFAMGLASVSLMGLPPSAAFVAKWTLMRASFASGQSLLGVVMVVGGLMAAVYMFRVLAQAFASPSDAPPTPPEGRCFRAQEQATLALATLSLLLGLATLPVAGLLEIGSPWPLFLEPLSLEPPSVP